MDALLLASQQVHSLNETIRQISCSTSGMNEGDQDEGNKLTARYHDELVSYGIEMIHARHIDGEPALAVYLWCKSEASVDKLRGALDAGSLRFLIDAIFEDFSEMEEKGFSVRTFIDPKTVEAAKAFFTEPGNYHHY